MHLEKVTFELSEKCNAACPLCVRTNPHDASKPIDAVSRKRELLVDDVKHILPTTVLNNLRTISLCGNVGDPIAAKDCLKISQYICEHPNVTLIIETNGSLRNAAWWTKMGEAFAKSHDDSVVYFHIDGLKDTNHIYRQLTNYDKIIENAKAFIAAGGKAIWEFIPFAHNEHQVEEAQEIAKSLGFSDFIIRKSNRKWSRKGETFNFINPKGEKTSIGPPDEKYMGSGVFKKKKLVQEGVKKEIRCRYKKNNHVFVNCDGVLHRCCYIPADLYKPKHQHTEETQMLAAQFNLEQHMNLLNFDPGAISHLSQKNDFFDTLEEEWEEGGPWTCQKVCGHNVGGSDRITTY